MSNRIFTKKKGDMHIATLCLSTTLVLIILGMIVLFLFAANNISRSVKENLTASLILDDSLTLQQGKRLTQELLSRPYTHSADFIGKDKVLKEETKAMGIDPSEFLDENPFMSSIELTLKAEYANKDSVKWIEKEWKHSKSITDVIYQHDLLDKINNNIQKISIVLIILAVFLLIVSFTLINNTIRLSVYSQRFKMHTMKLVGATYGFIRKPFLKKMMFVGIISASLACVFIGICIVLLYNYEQYAVSIITQDIVLITYISVFVLGLLISTVCTFISVNRFLKMKAADLYRY